MRIAPQLAVSTVDENLVLFQEPSGLNYTVQAAADTLYQRGFGSASLSPGSLDLGTMVSTIDRRHTIYSLPGGGGGRVLGQVPSGVDASAVQSMLPAFGIAATDTVVGYAPGPTSVPLASRIPYVQMGSTGHLVVALRAAGPGDATTGLTDEVMDDIEIMNGVDNPGPSMPTWNFPRRMLVIQGDVAYEFHYVDHTYMTRYFPYLAISQKTQLYSGHYLLTKIRNRFGESMSFAYDADGIGYTATWNTNPGVSIKVQAVGSVPVPAGQVTLTYGQVPVTTAMQVRVSYQGISQPVSSYLIQISDAVTGTSPGGSVLGGPTSGAATTGLKGQRANDMVHFDAANLTLQPLSVLEEGSGQQISFNWVSGPTSTWAGLSVSPTVLSSVTFPTRTVTLDWQAYTTRQNYNPESWTGMAPSSVPGRPAYCYGVSKVTDSDGTQLRFTTHTRVLPTSNWVTFPVVGAPLDQWVSSSFYDAITYPDGSISLYRFVEPPATNGTTSADGMQNIAFIKTLEREVRYYTPGQDWASDLAATNPSSSIAYKWVVKDRFDVRTVGAPDGSIANQAVPYPTRTRTWDKESQVLTTEETTGWDYATYGWKTSHFTSSISASPTLAVDYLSLALQGPSYSAYPATLGVERETDKTFSTDLSKWFIARVATEVTQVLQDNTGFKAPGVTLPDVQPTVTKTFNPTINRVDLVAVKGSDGQTVTTNITYKGDSGLQAVELASAFLNSPGLTLSGVMGVCAYGYDDHGYMNAISQKPNAGTTLTIGQSQDEVGRPTSQTDMAGNVQMIGWDSAGRLGSITPAGEPTTNISYDSDFRGITVTRGAQVKGYRYNGFGELILEKRLGPNGAWSHKIYGLDTMGRKSGETVWLPGNGAAQEGDWAKPNLTGLATRTTPERTVCKTWGLDGSGNATCLTWETIPATQTNSAAIYTGTTIHYDGRGRVDQTIDPNTIQVTTQYLGLTRQVTLGAAPAQPQVTLYTSDAAGRLAQVTDATGHVTNYFFDGGNRINQVQQMGDGGLAQYRTWAYNRLGWLTSLTQPESGITTYSTPTVAGKPTVTSYNGRNVSMTPDWMGRPTAILSSSSGDTSVAQSFIYDTAMGGMGKLASSTDGGITTSFTYGAAGGRLDSLTTTLLIQGAPQSFTQTFTYDNYGNRSSGSTSHNTWTQAYIPETGMPSLLSYGSTGMVASTPWESWDSTGWMLKKISYGNGVKTTFDYDADQTRLNLIIHSPASGGPFAQWCYNYNSLGNLYQVDNLVTGSFDLYGYDNLNRLVSALVESPTYGDQQQQFTYDAFGNRTSSAIMGVAGWSGARGARDSLPTFTTSALQSDPNRHVVNAAFNPSDTALKNQLPAQTSVGVLTGSAYDA
jgi:YD repeat-containing protein